MSDAHDHHDREESDEYKRMRGYDAEWGGQRFIVMGGITLVIALSVIYALASLGSG